MLSKSSAYCELTTQGDESSNNNSNVNHTHRNQSHYTSSPSSPNKPRNLSPMWDSSDPNRNPPPLPTPASISKLNNNTYKMKAAVGKLNFVQDDDNICDGLNKIYSASSTVDSKINNLDLIVRQTQMDLESLCDRSKNNNEHLKTLINKIQLSKELNESSETRLNKLSDKLLEKFELNENFNKSLINNLLPNFVKIEDKLGELESSNSSGTNELMENFKSKISHIQSTLMSLKVEQLENFDELTKCLNIVVAKEVSKTSQSNSEILSLINDSSISNKDDNSKIFSHLEAMLSKINNLEIVNAIHNKVEFLQKNLSAIDLQIGSYQSQFKSLNDRVSHLTFEEEFKTLNENMITKQHLIKANNIIAQNLTSLEANLNNKSVSQLSEMFSKIDLVSENTQELSQSLLKIQSTLPANLDDVPGQIDSMNKEIKNVFDSISTSIQTFSNDISQKVGVTNKNLNINTNLQELKQQNNQLINDKILLEKEIENRDLLLTLKDSQITAKDAEIEKLKEQLENKNKLHQESKTLVVSVNELKEKKTILKTQLEGLSGAYKQRYEELNELSQRYSETQSQINNLINDKFKNVINASTVSLLNRNKSINTSHTNIITADSNFNMKLTNLNFPMNNDILKMSPKKNRITSSPFLSSPIKKSISISSGISEKENEF